MSEHIQNHSIDEELRTLLHEAESDFSEEDFDEILASLDGDQEITAEQLPESLSMEDAKALSEKIQKIEAKEKLYQEQPAEVVVERRPEPAAETVEEEETVIEEEEPPVSTPAPRHRSSGSSAGLPPSQRIVKRIGTDPYAYRLVEDDVHLDALAREERRDAIFNQMDDLAKKTGEKAVNLLEWSANGNALSVYTEIAMKLLIDRGELTSNELKAAYANGSKFHVKTYSEGTANAQAGQIIQLFPVFGIARKSGAHLVLNEQSLLVKKAKDQFGL